MQKLTPWGLNDPETVRNQSIMTQQQLVHDLETDHCIKITFINTLRKVRLLHKKHVKTIWTIKRKVLLTSSYIYDAITRAVQIRHVVSVVIRAVQ